MGLPYPAGKSLVGNRHLAEGAVPPKLRMNKRGFPRLSVRLIGPILCRAGRLVTDGVRAARDFWPPAAVVAPRDIRTPSIQWLNLGRNPNARVTDLDVEANCVTPRIASMEGQRRRF